MTRCNDCVQGRGVSRAGPPSVSAASSADPGGRLFAHCRVAERVLAFDHDFASDDAVVIDTAGHGAFGAGVKDLVESGAAVEETIGIVGGDMVANDDSGGIDVGQDCA